ncbi:hypothetical protein NDU88_007073 [Pleurodeles waltl]|uniref:Uncharacterized protein n=1 Tax=Pleurodeles waltl TaxID=8319 RepID=A0AAV7LR05_PLEWA|nr:hypothetical protein NDU88_007073 [Pleurodeles waltl]
MSRRGIGWWATRKCSADGPQSPVKSAAAEDGREDELTAVPGIHPEQANNTGSPQPLHHLNIALIYM